MAHPDEIPPSGAFTSFCDPDELTAHWDELARRKMIRGICGGSPFPRKAMLEIMPPEKARAYWDEKAIRLALSEWEEASRRFPLKWLSVSKLDADEGRESFSTQEANAVSQQLVRAGLPPSHLGDILRNNGGIIVQVDKRVESDVASALAALGLGFQPARGSNPEDCADAVRLSVGSPRLDSVISRAYHIGRAEAKKAVVKGFVAVNMRLSRDATQPVTAGDVLHHLLKGAIRIDELNMSRKQGRHNLMCRIARSVRLLMRG
jgi:RNA-binding protein YlmH